MVVARRSLRQHRQGLGRGSVFEGRKVPSDETAAGACHTGSLSRLIALERGETKQYRSRPGRLREFDGPGHRPYGRNARKDSKGELPLRVVGGGKSSSQRRKVPYRRGNHPPPVVHLSCPPLPGELIAVFAPDGGLFRLAVIRLGGLLVSWHLLV